MTRTSIAAMTVAGLLLTTAARAQHGPDGGWHHDPLLVGVTLTDEQRSRVAALRKASREADRPLFEQMRAIQQKIDTTLVSAGTVTEATVAPLVQQKVAIMQQLEAARMIEQIAMRNLLTDAQVSAASTAHARLASLHEQERALHVPADAPPAN